MSWFSRRARPAAAAFARYRPVLETLEVRQCPAGGLSAPSVVSLSAAGATQATLSWTNVANETGYHILQWNGTQTVTLATVGADVTSYTATGLTPGQTIWLRVEAFNAAAHADSAWASLTLPNQPLTGATGLTATAVSTSEIDLHWT